MDFLSYSATDINSSEKATDTPLFETCPRSVPLSVDVCLPDESHYGRIFASKLDVSASRNIELMKNLDKDIAVIEKYLAVIYSKRQFTKPLFEYIQKIKEQRQINLMPDEFKTEEAKSISRAFLMSQIQLLNEIKNQSDCTSITLVNIFNDKNIWNHGEYSVELFEKIFFLIYKLTALEILIPSKTSVLTDISNFSKIVTDQDLIPELIQIRSWAATPNSITSHLLGLMTEKINVQATLEIFNIVIPIIQKNIAECSSLNPDMQFAYLNAYRFFLNFYDMQRKKELQQLRNSKKAKPKIGAFNHKIISFTIELIKKYPIIPLLFELVEKISGNSLRIPDDAIKFSSKSKPVITNDIKTSTLEEQLSMLRDYFKSISNLIAEMINNDKSYKENGLQLVKVISGSLKAVGTALNSIRLIISKNLSNPLPIQNNNDEKYSDYERKMRLGLKDDLNMILLLLHICRSIKELIQTNLPLIFGSISKGIQAYIQDFAYNKAKVLISNYQKDSSKVSQIVNLLRLISGYFPDDSFENLENKKLKKNQKPQPVDLESPPHLQIIEIIRIQLQHIINPESPYMTKASIFKSPVMKDDDIEIIKKFLNDTQYYSDFLQLNKTLNVVCDQSNLFFKEYYLCSEKVSFFPIATSLPMLLSDFALQHYQKPELTGAIFYPLTIYDDAASKALRYLKSRFLYKEIKEEARICLMSISRKLSDSAFHPIKKFASLRSLQRTILKDSSKTIGYSSIQESVGAIRLGVILQQNKLYLLGNQVDTKALISERMNDLIYNELTNIFTLFEKHGILVSIAVSKMINMMKYTYRILLNFGLNLMEFKDILSTVLASNTPNSVQSLLLFNIVDNLTSEIMYDYYLLTNPLRLIPKTEKNIDFSNLYTSVLGDIMQIILKPTTSLITIENFRELFWYLDDGAIAIISSQLVLTFQDLFSEFQKIYGLVKNNLQRIKNGPISLNCLQVFDRFEGAYRYFKDDVEISALFQIMSEIGNLLALTEMTDNAYLMKSQTTTQIASFFLEKNTQSDKSSTTEFFKLFDNEFQSTEKYFDTFAKFPEENEALQPFLYSFLSEFYSCVNSSSVFNEESQNMTDLTSNNGFAAIWSVLEFLYCLIEAEKDNTDHEEKGKENLGAIQKYGEGVLLCAAALLTITGQTSLYRAFGIGSKIEYHFETDFSVIKDENVQKFINAYKYVSSSVKCAIYSYQPAIQQLQS